MKSALFVQVQTCITIVLVVLCTAIPAFSDDDNTIERVFKEDRGELVTAVGANTVAIRVVEDLNRSISPFIAGAGLSYHHVSLRDDRFPPAKGHPTAEEMVKKLGVTMIRFPHGVYGQQYFWDNDERTFQNNTRGYIRGTRKNWFHTDDYIAFCRRVGAEPLLQVNAQTLYDPKSKEIRHYGNVSDIPAGSHHPKYMRTTKTPSPEMLRSIKIMARYAAKWVYYCNVVKKYNVRYWQIGNEDWDNPYMYSVIAEIFAKEMRKVDPDIVLIATYLEPIYATWAKRHMKGKYAFEYRDWENLAYQYAQGVDFLAVHRYWAGYEGLPKKSHLVGMIAGGWSNAAARFVERIRPVALTEWNTSGGSKQSFRHTHADALSVAARMNALVRDELKIAVIHEITKRHWGMLRHQYTASGKDFKGIPGGTIWRQTPSAHAFGLFNKHRGTHLVTYGQTGAASNYVVMKDDKNLFLIYVNAQAESVSIDLDIKSLDTKAKKSASLTVLSGKVLLGAEYNKWFTPGQPKREKTERFLARYPERIVQRQVKAQSDSSFRFQLPAWSIGYLTIPRR